MRRRLGSGEGGNTYTTLAIDAGVSVFSTTTPIAIAANGEDICAISNDVSGSGDMEAVTGSAAGTSVSMNTPLLLLASAVSYDKWSVGYAGSDRFAVYWARNLVNAGNIAMVTHATNSLSTSLNVTTLTNFPSGGVDESNFGVFPNGKGFLFVTNRGVTTGDNQFWELNLGATPGEVSGSDTDISIAIDPSMHVLELEYPYAVMDVSAVGNTWWLGTVDGGWSGTITNAIEPNTSKGCVAHNEKTASGETIILACADTSIKEYETDLTSTSSNTNNYTVTGSTFIERIDNNYYVVWDSTNLYLYQYSHGNSTFTLIDTLSTGVPTASTSLTVNANARMAYVAPGKLVLGASDGKIYTVTAS